MQARGGGRIINISSVAGKLGVPLRTAYCGAKHALLGFMDSLRNEEFARGSGISITNACPGSVRTNVARDTMDYHFSPIEKSEVEFRASSAPTKGASQ